MKKTLKGYGRLKPGIRQGRCGQIIPQFMNLTKSKTMYILLFVFSFAFRLHILKEKKMETS